MKTKTFLLVLVMQILLALPLVAQEHFTSNELFINDIVAKPLKASTLNAKDGDTINDYQEERQIIDDYLKRINPNFLAGDLRVIVAITPEEHLRFEVIYKQIPVDGYSLTLHPYSDTTLLITGANLFSNDIETTPVLTKEQAAEKLKLSDNRINDSTILSNRLIIFKDLKTEPYLCYKIEVAINSFEHYYYYVSAINGDIIFKDLLSRSFTSVTGTADSENGRVHETNLRKNNNVDSINKKENELKRERYVKSVYLMNNLDKSINVEMHRDSLHDEYHKWHLDSCTQKFTLEPNDTVYLDTFVFSMIKGVRYFCFPGFIAFDKFVNSYYFVKIDYNGKQYEYTNKADIKKLFRSWWCIAFDEYTKKIFGWE